MSNVSALNLLTVFWVARNSAIGQPHAELLQSSHFLEQLLRPPQLSLLEFCLMKKVQSLLPVDLSLPERQLMEDGTMFVRLPTLADLDLFWQENKGRFAFACEGVSCRKPVFLREYEWIFGPTKASVVRAAMRWDRIGVGIEFYDQAEKDPESHEAFFIQRETNRQKQMLKGKWTSADESEYRRDCLVRPRASYRGWWQLKNLPRGYDKDTWFNPAIQHEEICDPHMPADQVAVKLQEQTFDDWKESDVDQVAYHDRASVVETIRYWRTEKKEGRDYYGSENERESRVKAA
ncbi:hypothetical protein I5M04_32455, partial [Pseudomonas aeruginosa]|nr:hypothetical protein [Pseudomonas aeruginosa]